MNEALRLSAWLRANAKHMKYEEERVQMIKAAKMLQFLDAEIHNNLNSLQRARDLLVSMREMIEKANELQKQEAARGGQGRPVSSLWC